MKSTANTKMFSGYKRGKWRRSIEFMLTSVGFSVGMATLWRIPYLCIRNGGGTFMLTYCVSVVFWALPLFLMETCVGQYYGRSALVAWDFVPLFKGVGVVGTLGSTCCSMYYNSLVGWCLYYIVMTFRDPIPWTTCDNVWNTPSCVSVGGMLNVSGALNWTGNQSVGGVLSTEEYWQRHVLDITSGIEEIGTLNWRTSLCLCGAWSITFLVLCKGIESSRLVVYVTATVPFFILTILMIQGATLPGSVDGALFFITPQWEKLGSSQVWVEGFFQGLYSLGPGWGAATTLASHNDFHNNAIMDTIIMGILDTLACFLAGFAIFTVLGYASYITGVPVNQLPNSGPGLAFVTYPFTAATLPFPQLWSFLFFACVFFLAVDTQFTMVKVFVTGVCDAFPKILGKRKTSTTLLFCIMSNVFSLLFMTQGGMYSYVLTDWYFAALSLVTVNFFQSFVIGWIYGIDRFLEHVREMMPALSPKVLTALKYIWKYGSTIATFVVLVITMSKLKAPTYAEYHYPDWAVAIGWVIAALVVCPLPVVMVHVILTEKGSLMKRLRSSIQPVAVPPNHHACEKCSQKDTEMCGDTRDLVEDKDDMKENEM